MRRLTFHIRPYIRLAAAATLFGALFAGCSSAKIDPSESLFLTIALDKTAYRPGEMVVCQAELLNITDKPLIVRALFSAKATGNSNLHFRRAKKGVQGLVRRPPVTLDNTLIPLAIEIGPWQCKRQKFLFVNLTESTGVYELIASYDAPPLDPDDPDVLGHKPFVAINSRPVEYTVSGERLFKRDARGLLTRQEAIRLAIEQYGRPTASAEALQKETDSSLLDWWVTLERKPEDIRAGENPRVGFYVSPYGGRVSENAPAFPPSPEKILKENEQKLKSTPVPKPELSPVMSPRRPR